MLAACIALSQKDDIVIFKIKRKIRILCDIRYMDSMMYTNIFSVI